MSKVEGRQLEKAQARSINSRRRTGVGRREGSADTLMLLVLRREWKVMLEGSYGLNHGEHSMFC